MKAYIERRFADGEPEDRTKTYAAAHNGITGIIFYGLSLNEWWFQVAGNGDAESLPCAVIDLTYLEPTTIDSDLYQKANPSDHAEFVHHIAQEVASAIWESTGKGNSHFNQVDINHIAEICAEEIVRAKAR